MKTTITIFGTMTLLLFIAINSYAGVNSVDLPKTNKGSTKKVHSSELKITIEIPASMVETNELDSGVPFQYMDASEELYIIGNSEPAEEAKLALKEMELYDENSSLTENYLDFTISLMEENGTALTNQSAITAISAKNVKGKFMSVDGDVPGIDYKITYWLAAFEYNGNIYKFIFWTLASEKASVAKIAKKVFTSITFE
jgi:hypothetical protein